MGAIKHRDGQARVAHATKEDKLKANRISNMVKN